MRGKVSLWAGRKAARLIAVASLVNGAPGADRVRSRPAYQLTETTGAFPARMRSGIFGEPFSQTSSIERLLE